MKHSLHTKIRGIMGAALILLVLLAFPTGWLYDLWAGTGIEQGQKPTGDVQRLHRQEDIEACFLGSTPATVTNGKLLLCPLARLRDVEQEGTHSHHSNRGKRSVYVSEYITADYPLSSWEYMLQRIAAGGFYSNHS